MTRKILIVGTFFLLLLISCNLTSNVPSAGDEPQEGTAVALADTQLAQTRMALDLQLTMTAMAQSVPQSTYTPLPTYTQVFTSTQSIATVTVSIETNCRTGPGSAYPILGVLVVGQTAEVVGRSQNSDNWIIKLPSNPSVTCWLWGQYATVTGNGSALPVYTPPPTPTPVMPSTVTLTIYNNCGNTIFYAYISLPSDPSWGSDELGSSTISVGGTFSWSYIPDTYDIKVEDSSHNVLYTWWARSVLADTYLVACP